MKRSAIWGALTLALCWYLFCGEIERPPPPKPRYVLMFCDVTTSLESAERATAIKYTQSVLANLSPGTSYTLFPIQLADDIGPVADGKVTRSRGKITESKARQQWATQRDRIGQQIEGLYESSKRTTVEPRSCILGTLWTVKQSLQPFPAREYEREVVYISDMIEDCLDTPIGEVQMDKKDITLEIQRVSKLQQIADLSDVKLTVVIPSALDLSVGERRRPSLAARERFWSTAFKVNNFTIQGNNWYFAQKLPPGIQQPEKQATEGM